MSGLSGPGSQDLTLFLKTCMRASLTITLSDSSRVNMLLKLQYEDINNLKVKTISAATRLLHTEQLTLLTQTAT